MDANERLNFINRLSGLTGDQAREVLKQMAINCNTRQTTIARALKNAVDHHAPIQYLAAVAAPSSPSVATPSTSASSIQKTEVRDKGHMSDSGEDGGDDETPASKKQNKHKKHKIKRGDINPDPNISRLVLDKSTPKRSSAQFEAATADRSRHGALSSTNGKKHKTSPANNKNIKLENKRERIKEEDVIVIDSTSESDSSDSDSSDNDTGDNKISNHNFPDHKSSGDDSSSSTDTADTERSGSKSSDSDESIDLNPARRKLLKESTSSRRTAHAHVKQPAPVSSAQGAKKTAEKPKMTAVSARAETSKTTKTSREQVDRAAKTSSTHVIKKRKAEEAGQVEHADAEGNAQEKKKVKTSEDQKPVHVWMCRKCGDVFESRAHLFKHIQHHKHPVVPTIHASVPAPLLKSPVSAPGTQNRAPEQAYRHVDPVTKKEWDDQIAPLSKAAPKPKPDPEIQRAMPPPAFIKEPNSFPRGPTPAPMVLARRRTNGGATFADLPVRPGPALAAEASSEREYKCQFCYEYYKRSQNHGLMCRRHEGEL